VYFIFLLNIYLSVLFYESKRTYFPKLNAPIPKVNAPIPKVNAPIPKVNAPKIALNGGLWGV
jgi:hypothetical protein